MTDLNIGCSRRGRILVCHGDDFPDQWIGWLEPLIQDLDIYLRRAEEFGVKVELDTYAMPINDALDFCELIGVEFDSSHNEDSFASGFFKFGWIEKKRLKESKKIATELLDAIKVKVDCDVKRDIFAELNEIEDIEDLIDRTKNDRYILVDKVNEQASRISALEAEVSAINFKLLESNKKLDRSMNNKVDLDCVDLLLAINLGLPGHHIAGPLLLWEDGVMYVIRSIGGAEIPTPSLPAKVIESIENMKLTIVFVDEMTVGGGWTSGPIYKKGSPYIDDWENVWTEKHKLRHTFKVHPAEYTDKVAEIYCRLKAK